MIHKKPYLTKSITPPRREAAGKSVVGFPRPAGGGCFSWARRVTAVLLALLCAFGWGGVPGLVVLPGYAANTMTTEEATAAGLSWSGGTITGFTAPLGFSGVLAIPTKINSVPITAIGNNAFKGNTAIESATIPEGVTAIGYDAFNRCTNMQSITLPESLLTLGDSTFQECTSLESIVIPESVAGLPAKLFATCTSLKRVTLPEAVTQTTLGTNAFHGCTVLESVAIPEGITQISTSAFQNCIALQSVDFPSTLIEIGYRAFDNCAALQAATLFEGLTTISTEAFRACIALSSLTLPESLTTLGTVAFQGCDALEAVTIPGSVKTIGGNAFNGCNKLQTVTLSEGIETIEAYAFALTGLLSVTIPESVTTIGDYAFRDNIDLHTVTFLGSPTVSNSAFYNSPNIAAVNLPTGSPLTDYAFPSTPQITVGGVVVQVGGSTVTLRLNGGAVTSPLTSYPYGQTTELPIPEKSGYLFGGWYSTRNFEGNPVTQLTSTDRGTKTFYARWLQILSTPTAEIVYDEETIAFENIVENIDAAFTINGDSYTTDDNAKIPIDEDWFGETITIIAKGNGTETADSAAQSLQIPARPAPPSVTAVNESSFEGGNGKITGLAATTTYEYKPTGGTYTTITGVTEIANLAPGTYVVRVKAGNTSFASLDCSTLTIMAYVQSTSATLANLAVSPGTLTPSFAPGVLGYSVALPYDASSITVTATASDPNASVSGDGEIPLQTGANSIPLTVTAEDGVTTQTYTITVTVASPPPVEPDPPAYDPTKPNLPVSAPPVPEPPAPEPPVSPVTITTGFQNGRAYRDTRVNGKLEVRAYTTDVRVSGRTTGRAVEQLRKLFTQYFENPVAVVSLQPKTPLREAVEFAVRVDLSGFDPKNLWFYSYDATSNTYKRLTDTEYFLDRNGFLHFTTKASGDVIVSSGKLAKK
jgi:uncharacterized repeat protein (TIGR02543 family)